MDYINNTSIFSQGPDVRNMRLQYEQRWFLQRAPSLPLDGSLLPVLLPGLPFTCMYLCPLLIWQQLKNELRMSYSMSCCYNQNIGNWNIYEEQDLFDLLFWTWGSPKAWCGFWEGSFCGIIAWQKGKKACVWHKDTNWIKLILLLRNSHLWQLTHSRSNSRGLMT